MLRRFVLGATTAAALAFTAPVQAAPSVGLYLVMDGSGSITTADFTTQVTAYSAALQSYFTANPTAFGQVAIGASIFGANTSQFFATQAIDDQTDLDALKGAIAALDPGRGGISTGATAIGDAVAAASGALLAFETSQASDLRLVIDVSTDGQNNTGSNPATASGAAVGAGVNAVNCIGIGAFADCSWVAGFGTNFGTVSFANLADALARKITLETRGVPEPATLALLAVGLLGAGIAARRRKA